MPRRGSGLGQCGLSASGRGIRAAEAWALGYRSHRSPHAGPVIAMPSADEDDRGTLVIAVRMESVSSLTEKVSRIRFRHRAQIKPQRYCGIVTGGCGSEPWVAVSCMSIRENGSVTQANGLSAIRVTQFFKTGKATSGWPRWMVSTLSRSCRSYDVREPGFVRGFHGPCSRPMAAWWSVT